MADLKLLWFMKVNIAVPRLKHGTQKITGRIHLYFFVFLLMMVLILENRFGLSSFMADAPMGVSSINRRLTHTPVMLFRCIPGDAVKKNLQVLPACGVVRLDGKIRIIHVCLKLNI